MSERRFTAPKSGWYRFGGTRKQAAPDGDTVMFGPDEWVTEPYRFPEVGGHASTDATINDLPPLPASLMQPEAEPER